jgi:hypothetical protein
VAARASVTDFINQINAKPGYSISTNADGSLAIRKNGVVKFVSVFWNIQWGGYMARPWIPGYASKGFQPWSQGVANQSTVSGLCETSPDGYPTDSVTILPDGASGSGAPSMDAQAFLDNLK